MPTRLTATHEAYLLHPRHADKTWSTAQLRRTRLFLMAFELMERGTTSRRQPFTPAGLKVQAELREAKRPESTKTVPRLRSQERRVLRPGMPGARQYHLPARALLTAPGESYEEHTVTGRFRTGNLPEVQLSPEDKTGLLIGRDGSQLFTGVDFTAVERSVVDHFIEGSALDGGDQ